MIVSGQHRSRALANRHLRALQRQYGDARIISRRNSAGRFSKRGQYYEFEVREKTGKGLEFVVHFDYGGGRKRNLITFQFHVFAPGGVTDEEALQAIRDRAAGKKWPSNQWRARMLEYSRNGKDFKKRPKMPKGLLDTAVQGGEGRVTRRDSIRLNRRTRRKAR